MKPIALMPIVVKPIVTASLMCALAWPMLGQQQEPAPPAPPAPQQQNQAATTAPPEIAPDDPDFGEPVGIYYWLSKGAPRMRPGLVAAAPQNQILNLPNARPRSPGVSASMPAGKFNHLEISYFQVDGDGNSYAAVPLGLFGSNIPQGDLISTNYRVRTAQLTWNYLMWPAPPEDSKWRFRTLLSFDYTSANVTVDAPYELSTTFQPAHGTRNIFYPAFGLEMEYIPNKHFYFEARTSGFGVPHRADIGDAEANAVWAYKHLEVFGGYKLFHFKTSPKSDEFVVGTLTGPAVGVRWVLR